MVIVSFLRAGTRNPSTLLAAGDLYITSPTIIYSFLPKAVSSPW